MKIIPIGVGNAFTQRFYHSNFLLELGAKRYLIDAGSTLRYSLPKAGLSPPDIDGIFITHFHSDHIGGLDEFACACMYVHHVRPALFIHQQQQQYFESFFALTGEKPGNYLDAQELPQEKPFHIDGSKEYHARYIDIVGRHPVVPSNFSIAIEERDGEKVKRIIFTGDINSIPKELLELINDPNTLAVVHDCNTQSTESEAHISIDKIIETYPEQTRSKIFITHYEDKIEQHYPKIKAAKLNIAQQGIAIEV